jgi:hypothetical protein
VDYLSTYLSIVRVTLPFASLSNNRNLILQKCKIIEIFFIFLQNCKIQLLLFILKQIFIIRHSTVICLPGFVDENCKNQLFLLSSFGLFLLVPTLIVCAHEDYKRFLLFLFWRNSYSICSQQIYGIIR